MQYKELNEQQSRIAIDIGQLYEAHSQALRQLADMKGTLMWKVLRGKTYLFKKLDAKGNGRVIGLRSFDTEATLQAARGRKAELKERLRSLRARLAEQARLAKALRIARVPRTTAAVLRVLNRAGLLGRNIVVVGTNALYAYEAAGGVHFDSSVMETADVDILREARSRLTLAADVRGAGLIGLLRQADRSFEQARARSFRAVNRTWPRRAILPSSFPRRSFTKAPSPRTASPCPWSRPTRGSSPCTSSGSPNSPTANP